MLHFRRMQNGTFAEHQTFPKSPELGKPMHPTEIHSVWFWFLFGKEGRSVQIFLLAEAWRQWAELCAGKGCRGMSTHAVMSLACG